VWLTEADFREPVPNEVCAQLTLTDAEAEAGALDDAILRFEARLEDHTNDRFEPEDLTLEIAGDGTSTLDLPYRTQAVTMVEFVDPVGDAHLQPAESWRLKTSLYASGTQRAGELDWIMAVVGGVGFTTSPVYLFPPAADGYLVMVTGTFGWAAPPSDMRRALALMVHDHFKPQRADLRRAQSWRVEDAAFDASVTTPTGIPEADEIIATYRRDLDPVGV